MRSPADLVDVAPRRRADAGRGSSARPGLPDSRRRVLAVLRWRAHLLASRLPAATVVALRLLPALLHASFEPALAGGEPPGVAGVRYRRRWSALARAVGLPPPSRARRGPPRVEAVLAVPSRDGLDVLAICAARASDDEVAAVRERLAEAERVLARAGVRVRARALEPVALAGDGEAVSRVVALGALLGGRLGDEAWKALESALSEPLTPRRAAALAADAPGPLAALALTLLAHRSAPSALAALRRALRDGAAPASLVDPERFCVRWASQTAGVAGPLERVVEVIAAAGGGGPASELLELGRALALRCARLVRATRGVDPEVRRAWAEALGAGFPRVLQRALGDRIAASTGQGSSLSPALEGRTWTVRLPDGALLARGASPVQARARALALVATSLAARRGMAAARDVGQGLDPTWRALGQRLARPRGGTRLVLLVEAGAPSTPEPPFDPLNRGLARRLDFEGALAVRLGRPSRPSARVLTPMKAVEAALRHAGAVEVLAPRAEAAPAAGRIAQVAALARRAAEAGPAVAIEAGGEVLVPRGAALRRYALARFAARPRLVAPDPAAPDLSLSTGSRGRGGWRADRVVQCRVTLARPGVAALLFVDAAGAHLREELPVAEVEDRLAEARAIVQQARIPAVIAVRLGDEVAPGAPRLPPPEAQVDVAGELPWIEVVVGGERFGARSGLRWSDAAEALLAASPSGAGRFAIRSARATERGAPASALALLWAASVARRRLRTHLERAISTYRAAATGRRGG